MKRCPQCNRVETDDALAFCRTDGTPLINDSAPTSGEAGTARLGSPAASSEIDTSILSHTTHTVINRDTSSVVSGSSQETHGLTKPKRWKPLIALGALLIILIVVGGYFYTKGKANRPIESVAVLPFENKSGNPDSEYLSDGLAESLIYRLSQLSNLRVSPRSSVFRYKGKEIDAEKIGNELGVDAVMSGRLIQRGDDLTISVDLIDVRNKKTLWGEQFERKMSDLLATQRDIATAISQKLQLKLSGDESKGLTKRYTNDNEAYQLYLKGRFYWNRRTAETLQKAIEQFKAAADKDPGFALAYAGLADCYAILPFYSGKRGTETLPVARSNASKAIELDSSLAEPHTSLILVNNWEWKFAEAETEAKRAIELNPNYATAHHWYSRVLRATGRTDEAWTEIKRANELDPLSMVIINNIAEQYIERGDTKSAMEECRRMIDFDPSFWAAYVNLGTVFVKQGRYAEALIEGQKAVDLAKRSNASLAFVGHIYGRMGRRAEAEGIIKELQARYDKQQADGRDLAVVYAGLDEKDQAFVWLEKAFKDHSCYLAILRLEPSLDSLKSDPRWNELLRRVGV